MCCPDHVIAVTDVGMANICLVLNIIWPGLGTIINACYGKHACTGVLIGLAQLFLTIFFIGWIWSIVYGCKIVEKAKHHHEGGFQKDTHHEEPHHNHGHH